MAIAAPDLMLLLHVASHTLETELAVRLSELGITPRENCVLSKALGRELMVMLAPRAAELGAVIVTAGVRDLILPGDMKELMNKVTEAKKAAEANLIVRREELQHLQERRADDRVAPDPDARRLAQTGVGHGLDRFVGERPRAAHDPDPSLAMDGARDDADLGPAG